MKSKSKLSITIFILFTICTLSMATQPDNLQCEYLVNPLGIDTPSPRLSWLLDDNRYGAIQNAYRIIVGTDSAAVARGQGNSWDTQKMSSDKMLVEYQGDALQPFTRYYWQVRLWDKDNVEQTSDVASFETGMMSRKNWQGAWISDGNDIDLRPAPYFRKEFQMSKKVKSARVYIVAAGLYELYINGNKVGDHRLDPTYTRFDRRNLYVTYDVTDYLQTGDNAVGVLLGNGWYNHQPFGPWNFDRAPWRDRPAFCLDMRIACEDGSVETIVSERDWKTALSPVISSNIYTAEHYDARLEQPGWNIAGFDDSKWNKVIYRTAPSLNIVSQQLHPIRNVEKIPTKTMTQINDSTWLFDLGRNISGVSQFRVTGETGTVLRLKHVERLTKDGRADMSNVALHYRPKDDSDPIQVDIFILGGKGEEEFMPRFNYKGFQYVEVTSSKPVRLTKESLTGWFMHSDVPPVGKVETSNTLVNKLWWATNNSYLSNLFGYPTDCPQREKNGWTGDAHFAIESGLYNFAGITIYEKWLADHRDEQQPNGVLPDIIPTGGWGYGTHNGTDWTSTIAIIPWNVYLFYGDSRLLSDCYENIRMYVNYIERNNPSGLTSWGRGDWVPVKSKSSRELTSSAYYYVDALILSKAARLFGKDQDAAYYAALADKIKKAINDKYLDRSTGLYATGTQTELSVPLLWGIVPDELKAKVATNLAEDVKAKDYHLDVGVLGCKAILNALSENGQADVAYKLSVQNTYPSWGWWIVNGATTLYENWNIDAVRDNSLNHMMFGELGAWFFKALGGIKPDETKPGFKNVLLRPHFFEGMTSASITHQSPYGDIISKWERKKKDVIYSVTIPANSTADLYLPEYIQLKKIKLSDGKIIDLQKNTESGYHLVAGSYIFELTNGERSIH